MNIKIITHFMPWEIDHALLLADKLKKSLYYIENTDHIYIDMVLNLSSSIIDWDSSILKKDFFIEKYNVIIEMLKTKTTIRSKIYDGDAVYGHLDLQKEAIESHIDAYIYICPDISFHEHLLFYLVAAAKTITDDYYLITPQIFKCWDNSWDELVHPAFLNTIPTSKCIDIDIHEIEHKFVNLTAEPAIRKLNNFKFAGWFDLYNKNFIEKFVPILDEWHGYGPWDLYSLHVCQYAKDNGVNVCEYLLENQLIWFYDTGVLKNDIEYGGYGKLKTSYKKFIKTKIDANKQRAEIEKNIGEYLTRWVSYAKQNKIL